MKKSLTGTGLRSSCGRTNGIGGGKAIVPLNHSHRKNPLKKQKFGDISGPNGCALLIKPTERRRSGRGNMLSKTNSRVASEPCY